MSIDFRRNPSTVTWLAVVLAMSLLLLPGAAVADDPPEEEAPPPARVLVYSGTGSFRHSSIDHGNPILESLAGEGEEARFVVDFTEDPANIAIDVLRDYDMVLWNSPSGESFDGIGIQPAQACAVEDALDGYTCTSAPFTKEQREQFIAWSECGGGFVGIHQVLDAWHDWPAWDELVGFVFLSHFQAAEAEVFVEADDPIVSPFGAAGSSFVLREEYYTTLPGDGPDGGPDYAQLLGVGEFSDPVVEAGQGAFYADHGPLAWTSSFRGANRVFISNLGHSEATWDLPAYQQHLLAGIDFVDEVRPDPACVAAIGGGDPGPSESDLPPVQGVVVSPPLSASSSPGFYPEDLSLPRGSSLTYVSVDIPIDGAHLLVSEQPGLFRGEFGITTGQTRVIGVEALAPGRYPYICQIHPAMRASLTIL